MQTDLVIVVDMINGFVKYGALSDTKIMRILPNIKAILDKTALENILFVCDRHTEDAKEFSSFPAHCIAGDTESDIIDELKKYSTSTTTVYKNSTNAFYKLDLEKIKAHSRIILVGCCTDICVLQLALSLRTYFNEFNLDQEVIVVEDACDTFSAPHHHGVEYHNMGLSLMKQSGIIVTTLRDLNQ